MALTADQRAAVQLTFDTVAEDGVQFASAFYENLFKLNPSLRKLFNRDMAEQSDLIMRMMQVVVRGLDYMDNLMPALQDIGLHHKGYGVKAEDYKIFGVALKQTIAEALGDKFTPEASEAWDAFFKFLTDSALQGAAAG